MKAKYFRVPVKQITKFHYIFEAYDELATVTIIDGSEGFLKVLYHISREHEVKVVLESLISICEYEEITLEYIQHIKAAM